MAVNDLITFRKGVESQWISANPVLASGEPGYDLTNSILKIGDGVSNWVALSGIGSTSVGGSSSSSVGVRGIISTTGILTNFAVSGGYPVGYLDLFQDGVKLVSSLDFSATDGSNVTLSNSVPSGTVLEYASLSASISSSNYTKLDSISSSFNGSSTSFGLTVSGTVYYPVSANTLGIYVGGVAQEPISSYSVSGSNIVFTEAPASGLTFWGVGYGTTAVATLNGIVPGSSGSPAISSSNDLTTGFYFPSSGNISIAGNLGIGTSSPSTLLDLNNDKFRVRNSKTPSSTTDIGNQGDICWDSSYIYVCTSTNSWKRSSISSWSSDPYFSYISLLLHMDGTGATFVDSSATPKTITALGDATQSTAQSKWGGKSAYFDGSGDSVSAPDITLSGNFVFECWLRWNGTISKDFSAIAIGTNANSQFFLTTKQNRTGLRFGLTGVSEIGTGSFTWVPDTWYYVALVRSGSAIRMYVDGANVTDGSPTGSNTFSGELRLAGDGSGPYDSNIYLDDVRLTAGSDRSYTGSTITVPTASFPDYNT
jgi:hypothetical protein